MDTEARSSRRKHVRFLVAILAAALVLRLAALLVVYSIEPGRVLGGDSPSYDNPARALLRTGRFAASPETPDEPETIRTPGYPAFIAAVYLVFGERHFPVIAVQILVSVGTIWMAYVVAKRVWGPGPALIAALLLTLDVASFVSSQKLLTDALFTFLAVVAVAAGVRLLSGEGTRSACEGARNAWALLLGVALALATMVRPISYYLVFPVLIGLFVWGCAAKLEWKPIGVILLLVAAPSVLLVGGWQVRNYRATGSCEFSHIQAHNLLWYRGAGIVALRDGISLDEARERIRARLPAMEGWTVAEEYGLYRREGLSLVRAHPVLLARMQVREAADVLLAPAQVLLVRYLTGIELAASPFGDVFRLTPGAYVQKWVVGKPALLAAFLYEMLYLAVLYVCVLYALWRIVRTAPRHLVVHLLVWGVILYLVVLSSGPEAHSRFRVPVMPLLVVYAGQGLSALVGRLRAARSAPGSERAPESS